MKHDRIAKILATGIVFSAITTSVEASAICSSNDFIFGVEPREIVLCNCEADVISIGNIQTMIALRNHRDRKMTRSSTDRVAHL